MRTAGIIAEYNPFHAGHAYQIAKLKQQGFDAIVCVCSPGVVQRGTAALFPTQVRTQAALAGGADLIISLPAPYATLSAEGFAAAGTALLDALGCVDALCFGSESEDVQAIIQTADILLDDRFPQELRKYLDAGFPAAAARAQAAQSLLPGAGTLLSRPNDILGVEYCKALKRLNSTILPFAITRQGAPHDAPLDTGHGKFASASALRALAAESGATALAPYVPKECLSIYCSAQESGMILDEKAFGIAVLSRLRMMSAQDAAKIRGAAEGLENRLVKAVRDASTLPEVIELMKTKRYPTARLRRFVLDAALGYQNDLPQMPPYLHILGASKAGLAVLSKAKMTAKLPLSHSLAELSKKSRQAEQIAFAHAAAEDLTALCLKNPAPCKTAYTAKPLF